MSKKNGKQTSVKKTPSVWRPKELEKKKSHSKESPSITLDELLDLEDINDLTRVFDNSDKAKKLIEIVDYQKELEQLQIELIKLQQWVMKNNKRVAILFEGRDAAGKGGAIRRFIEHLNPRSMRVVALPKPTEVEMGQWYFQRYINQLPNPGEIVFFDRSWYNRAVVEPVNGFCTNKQYKQFLVQVSDFEHMLYEDGIILFKFWFSISKSEQLKRFNKRKQNPLKQWKISPVDLKAQNLWDKYSHYKEEMFYKTHSSYSPWIIVQANVKKEARLASIRYVLDHIDYKNKGVGTKTSLHPDPNVIQRFHRRDKQLD